MLVITTIVIIIIIIIIVIIVIRTMIRKIEIKPKLFSITLTTTKFP